MNTVAILPVKRFSHAKQRLSAALPADLRRALAEAMVSDVLRALHRASAVEQIIVVTAEPMAAALALSHDAQVIDDPRERSHSDAAALGIAACPDADRVLLVPGDCPGLAPDHIDELLASAGDGPAVTVVPDRHGTGTNALVLTPPTVMAPAFGPGSRARHVDAATAAGAHVAVTEVPSLAMDVDTIDDIAALRDVLDAQRGTAANTRGILSRISSIR